MRTFDLRFIASTAPPDREAGGRLALLNFAAGAFTGLGIMGSPMEANLALEVRGAPGVGGSAGGVPARV